MIEVNPALIERVGAGNVLLGESLAILDASPPVLADAAQRARTEQRTLLLRAAVLRARGREFAADLAFTPLDRGEVLVELFPEAPSAEHRSAHLSASLKGFAHEVKNPLAGVRGAAQLLQREPAPPERDALCTLILTEVDRLAALADRLLHGGSKPRLTRIGVHELTERVAALIDAQSPALRQIRDYDPSLPAINADADRLTQLLINLARNAIEAGARTLTWRSRAEHAARIGDHGVRLAIRIDLADDGAGVPAALRESLFEPLVSGRANGSGLGLALAREIAREHGGDLRHRSRPGATVFSLLLPIGATHV